MLLDMDIGAYEAHLFGVCEADVKRVGDELGVLLLFGQAAMRAERLGEFSIGLVLDEAGEEVPESSHSDYNSRD